MFLHRTGKVTFAALQRHSLGVAPRNFASSVSPELV